MGESHLIRPIDDALADKIEDAGIERVKIRSVLTCAARCGVCAKCYGRDLSTGKMVGMGLAAGVIAAQSIGEPGTRLTMRTFHIGGTASRVSDQSTIETRHKGTVRFGGLQTVAGRLGDARQCRPSRPLRNEPWFTRLRCDVRRTVSSA